jgi:hypothetical protein
MDGRTKLFQYSPEFYETLEDHYPTSWHWISDIPDQDFMVVLLYFEEVADNTDIRDILALPKELHRFMLATFIAADQKHNGEKFYLQYKERYMHKAVHESYDEDDESIIEDITDFYIKGDLNSIQNLTF